MANTGYKVTLNLKEVNQNTGDPTATPPRPNVQGNVDYIAPVLDVAACPIVYSLVAPDLYAKGVAGKAVYEFHLPNAVLRNPAVLKVKTSLRSADNLTELAQVTTAFPNPTGNYFEGELVAAAGASLRVDLQYLGDGDAVLVTHANLKTVTIS